MPIIKNGQYADILLRKEHTHFGQDVTLRDKYYRVIDNVQFVVWHNVWYEITFWGSQGQFLSPAETTGVILNDDPRPYQLEFRKLPLIWKRGSLEIRKKTPTSVTVDAGYGWLVDAKFSILGSAGEVYYSQVVCLGSDVRARVRRVLTEMWESQ